MVSSIYPCLSISPMLSAAEKASNAFRTEKTMTDSGYVLQIGTLTGMWNVSGGSSGGAFATKACCTRASNPQ